MSTRDVAAREVFAMLEKQALEADEVMDYDLDGRLRPLGRHAVTDARADFMASSKERWDEERLVELAEISRLIREHTARTMERRDGETVVEWSRRLAAAVEALR